MRNKYFDYHNCNPSGKEREDCVYRALSVFLDTTWEEVAKIDGDFYLDTGLFLMEVEKETGKTGAEIYLEKNNYKKVAFNENRSFKNRESLKDFIDNYADKKKTYFFPLGNHVTVIKNNKIIDTWDCSDYLPDYYFEK